MKRRWVIIGACIVFVALLGLWIDVRRAPVCENCAAKDAPFFQVFSSPTLNAQARVQKFSSLASQTYTNFRVAISSDEAQYPDVEEFIKNFPERFV